MRTRLSIYALYAALLTALLLLGAGCGSSSSDSSPGDASRSIDFNLTLTSILRQANVVAPLAVEGYAVAGEAIPGILLVTNTDTLEYTVYEWPAFWDGEAMVITPTRTIILVPGQYDFYMLLAYENQQYAGTAHLVVTLDGQNSVPMTIRPIIGQPLVFVTQVAELADFRFQYDPAELSGFINPEIGIAIDGNPEQIFAVNPATGLSDTYINIPAGTHQIQLRFYNAGIQIGKSLASQETVFVAPGVGIGMDLIVLFGTVLYALDEGTGLATFQYDLPEEILEELGGDGNLLSAIFSIVGDENALQEVQLGPSVAPPDFTGSVTLGGMVAGDVSIMFDMHNTNANPPKWFASCVVAQAFLGGPVNTKLCRFIIKRAVIDGSLLATVGVNVLNVSSQPVPGAVVYVDGQMMGITGSGAFGTPGYLKLTLPAGLHKIRAEANGMFGEVILDLAPLDIVNPDIVLDTPL